MKKLKKKAHESTVFLREWTFFLTNMGMGAVCFLENRRIFDKILA